MLPSKTKFNTVHVDLPKISLPVIDVAIPDLRDMIQTHVDASIEELSEAMSARCRGEVQDKIDTVLSLYTFDRIKQLIEAEVRLQISRSVRAKRGVMTRREAASKTD